MSDAETRRLIQRAKAMGPEVCAEIAAELCPKVYFVESGSYSDYEVVAVFASKAQAEAWIENAKQKDAWYFRDLHPVRGVPLAHDERVPGTWRACLDAEGNLSGRVTWCPGDYTGEERGAIERKELGGGVIRCFVGDGKSQEHAIRSAQQVRREFLVANPGVV